MTDDRKPPMAPEEFYAKMHARLAEAMLDGVPSGTCVEPKRMVKAMAEAVASTLGSFGQNHGPQMAVLCMEFLDQFHAALYQLATRELLDKAVNPSEATKQ